MLTLRGFNCQYTPFKFDIDILENAVNAFNLKNNVDIKINFKFSTLELETKSYLEADRVYNDFITFYNTTICI
jgi:hypothetical protein